MKRTFHKGQILTLLIQDMAFVQGSHAWRRRRARLWSSFKTHSPANRQLKS